MTAIIAFAAYAPRFRIRADEFARVWGRCAARIQEKAVPDFDEDSLTMGIAAARLALDCAGGRRRASVLSLGSTTLPYSEKASAGMVSLATGIGRDVVATEHSQSSRAGVEALLTASALLGAVPAEERLGLVVAADAPRASARDATDHGLGAGAAAFVLAGDGEGVEVEAFASAVDDYPGERFRPTGSRDIEDIGVGSYAEEAYGRTVRRAVMALFERSNLGAGDFAHAVFQQMDGRLPTRTATALGFSQAQLSAGFIYPVLGDLGAASCPVALCAALEVASPGDRLLLVSYGAGCGADALSLRVVAKPKGVGLGWYGERKEYIDYIRYLKLRGQIL